MIRNVRSSTNLLAVMLAGLIYVAAIAIATPAQATPLTRAVEVTSIDAPPQADQPSGSAPTSADLNVAQAADLKKRVDEILAAIPGGKQVSANEVAPTDTPPASDQPAGRAKTFPDFAITASPCWYNGAWWCNNVVGAALRVTDWTIVDYMYTNPSWFVCRADGGWNNNGPHPYRWVWTQGDAYGAWGWMSDSDIYSETDPLPVC